MTPPTCPHPWTEAIERAVHPRHARSGGALRGGITAAVGQPVVGRCRALFEGLHQRIPEGGLLTVASPHRGDGRSTVAAGLAVAVSRDTGGPVLLLDLDLERPSQARRFGVSPLPGLSGCLADAGQLTLVPVAPGLWLLPAGSGSREQSPGLVRDLVETRLLAGCRAAFRWTIVDLPPMLDSPEVGRVTDEADGVILVGRYRSTRVDTILEIGRRLSGAPIAFVMTAHGSPRPGGPTPRPRPRPRKTAPDPPLYEG